MLSGRICLLLYKFDSRSEARLPRAPHTEESSRLLGRIRQSQGTSPIAQRYSSCRRGCRETATASNGHGRPAMFNGLRQSNMGRAKKTRSSSSDVPQTPKKKAFATTSLVGEPRDNKSLNNQHLCPFRQWSVVNRLVTGFS